MSDEVSDIYIFAQAVGMDLSAAQQVSLIGASIVTILGVPSVPMAGVITLAVLLVAMGLPTDYIGMFMAIDILCDMPKTLGVFVALDYLHYNYDKWEQMPVQIQNNPTIKEMVAEWQRAATEIMPQIELNEEIITIE